MYFSNKIFFCCLFIFVIISPLIAKDFFSSVIDLPQYDVKEESSEQTENTDEVKKQVSDQTNGYKDKKPVLKPKTDNFIEMRFPSSSKGSWQESQINNFYSKFYKGYFYELPGLIKWCKWLKSSDFDSNKYIELCELNSIYQIGLNISNFMDIDTFRNLPIYNSRDLKTIQKNDVVVKAVNYFAENGLTDPKEIYGASKRYFQNLAEEAYNNGNYQLAYTYFTSAMEGEKDDFKLEKCRNEILNADPTISLSKQNGSLVLFGRYEQDGNVENGPEPIEWIVLDSTGDKLILLSKYVLTHGVINSAEKDCIWPDSELCAWLNNEFYGAAFDEHEKKLMRKIRYNFFYKLNYEGDFVGIPSFKDMEKLDYYWLKTYAVPSNTIAKDLIDFDGKPFTFTRDDSGFIDSMAKVKDLNKLRDNQARVITSNTDINTDSEFVYWPSGYWINSETEQKTVSNNYWGKYYCFCDENGYWRLSKATNFNGIRPIISIVCSDSKLNR